MRCRDTVINENNSILPSALFFFQESFIVVIEKIITRIPIFTFIWFDREARSGKRAVSGLRKRLAKFTKILRASGEINSFINDNVLNRESESPISPACKKFFGTKYQKQYKIMYGNCLFINMLSRIFIFFVRSLGRKKIASIKKKYMYVR